MLISILQVAFWVGIFFMPHYLNDFLYDYFLGQKLLPQVAQKFAIWCAYGGTIVFAHAVFGLHNLISG